MVKYSVDPRTVRTRRRSISELELSIIRIWLCLRISRLNLDGEVCILVQVCEYVSAKVYTYFSQSWEKQIRKAVNLSLNLYPKGDKIEPGLTSDQLMEVGRRA
jgi:hypothetical protein